MDNDRSTFKRRLGIYLMGVSIGLMLLGIFHMQRKSAEARQAQIRAQQQGQQPGQQQGQQQGQPTAPVPAQPSVPAANGDEPTPAEVAAQKAAEEKIKAEQQNPPSAGDSPGGP